MKKILFSFMVAFAALGFVACNNGTSSENPDAIPVESISFSFTSDLIEVGEVITLSPTVLPSTATNKSVVWKSDNEAVATVVDGVVEGIATGQTVITATTVDGNFPATFTVKVAEDVVGVVSVSLNVTAKRIARNEEFQLIAILNPEYATDKGVSWDIEDSAIASISQTGVVKGISGGVTTVTVTTDDGGLQATCEITVNVPLKEVSLSPSEIGPGKTVSFIPGETVPVKVSFNPADPLNTGYDIRVLSGGGDIISYARDTEDEMQINVTAKKPGTTTMIVSGYSPTGAPITANCTITVSQMVEEITFNPATQTLMPEGTVTLVPIIAPANAVNQAVTWSSSNTNVATVDQNGKVTVVASPAVYEVDIIATAKDGYLVDGQPVSGSCKIFIKAEDPIFGYVSFRSEQTWEIGNWIWSDYVTATRCKTDTADFKPTDDGGDCLKNPGYYDLFSYYAVRDKMTLFCTDGWSNPYANPFNDTDTALYPIGQNGRAFSMGTAAQYKGTSKWVEQWGLEYGGYWNGTAIVRSESAWNGSTNVTSEFGRFWYGGPNATWPAAPRGYISLYKEGSDTENGPDSSTLNRNLNVTTTSNHALGLRCVKAK
jgi:uncharacterized protein YjdB